MITLQDLDKKLTPHFTLREFIVSDVVRLNGWILDACEYVNDERLDRITKVAEALESVRQRTNTPIFVTSGLRMPKHNAAIPGSHPQSNHMKGYCADIVCRTRVELRHVWTQIKKCKLFDLEHCYMKDTSKSCYCHLQIWKNTCL